MRARAAGDRPAFWTHRSVCVDIAVRFLIRRPVDNMMRLTRAERLGWREVEGMSEAQSFSEEQQRYLQGFVSGVATRRAASGLPPVPGASTSPADDAASPAPESMLRVAQDRVLAKGGKLTAEEKAKRAKHPLDRWDEISADAAAARFPKGPDVFLDKFYGLFFVAPAENAYMCRLRMPNGILDAHQLRGVASVAEKYGAGFVDITTRANLQIRRIKAKDAVEVLTAIQDLGLTTRGSGADNIRNITSSPTAGIDPQELIDTRALGRSLHHYILNHREMYGLPRKFNIAFDGGGQVSVVEDTNDIGFAAVEVDDGHGVAPGIYFRLQLGGITGHGDFARDCGVLVTPDQCIAVAAAVVRVFIEHGDRTDRHKARLKYVLDRWGLDKYLEETESLLSFKLPRIPREACRPRGPILKHGHIGVHPQRQAGLNYLGVVVPVGRLDVAQAQGLADLAERHGSGTIRLTVWQNLLISDIPDERLVACEEGLRALSLGGSTASIRGALVACTGNTGCKFAATNTKGQALALADYLDARIALDQPINIHLTGCSHSCAQHYIGDIGLLGAKVAVGEEVIEGYHVYVGGGSGPEQKIGRELLRSIPYAEVPAAIERMLRAYLDRRLSSAESFQQFTARHDIEALRAFVFVPPSVAA